MKLRYLGTSAAEGWPALFCSCDNCRRAAEKGGRNIRTRSQAIVDDRLLIDFPADTYFHVLNYGLNLAKIKDCIITHSHEDHFTHMDFAMRRKPFAHLPEEAPMIVYGTEPVGTKMQALIELTEMDKQNILFYKSVSPFIPFHANKYVITPLRANHDPKTGPVIYIIDDGEKCILYGNDTGYFPEDTWDYLKYFGRNLDFVSLDCTTGINPCRNGHMGLETILEVKEELNKIGRTDCNTVFCLNHFSHNGGKIYEELVPEAEKHGFLVSYDNMEVEI